MSSRGRRVFRRNLTTIVSLVVFSITYTLFSQNIDSLEKFFILPHAQVQFAQEVPKVLKANAVSVPVVLQKGLVLGEEVSDTTCGKWNPNWPCDKSKLVNNLVNGKLRNRAGKTISFEGINFKKEPQGLEIPTGQDTNVDIVNDKGTKDEKDDTTIYKGGLCLMSGKEYESLAVISLSQPLLPKTIQGLNLSIRPVNAEKDQYAKIDLDWLATLKPEQYEKLFCALVGSYSEAQLRSMDIFGSAVISNQFGADWPSMILAKCNGRPPGESSEKFVKELNEDKGVESTIFKVLIERNEDHQKVKDIFRPLMIKTGLSGIVIPGDAPYIGGLAFQPKSKDTYIAKLSGSSGASKILANQLASPQRDTESLKTNGGIVQMTAEGSSDTLLSITEGALQGEYERATIESALFGGIFYIPDTEIEKGGNASMLSYDPKELDPNKYMCNKDSKNNNCPVIRAVSKCSSIGYAGVSIRLRQILLSAINDTDSYAGITPDGVGRSYTLAGDHFQGQFRIPETSIEKASVDELVVYSGKATPSCSQYASSRISVQGESKLSDTDKALIPKMAQNPNYQRQQILVSPVNVKYKTWANYRRDPAILAIINLFLPKILELDEYTADEINGEVIRPALISFKADFLYRGSNFTAVGSEESLNVQTDMVAFLDKLKIKPLQDGHIDCGLGSTGAEYWICSDNEINGLPKCQ